MKIKLLLLLTTRKNYMSYGIEIICPYVKIRIIILLQLKTKSEYIYMIWIKDDIEKLCDEIIAYF